MENFTLASGRLGSPLKQIAYNKCLFLKQIERTDRQTLNATTCTDNNTTEHLTTSDDDCPRNVTSTTDGFTDVQEPESVSQIPTLQRGKSRTILNKGSKDIQATRYDSGALAKIMTGLGFPSRKTPDTVLQAAGSIKIASIASKEINDIVVESHCESKLGSPFSSELFCKGSRMDHDKIDKKSKCQSSVEMGCNKFINETGNVQSNACVTNGYSKGSERKEVDSDGGKGGEVVQMESETLAREVKSRWKTGRIFYETNIRRKSDWYNSSSSNDENNSSMNDSIIGNNNNVIIHNNKNNINDNNIKTFPLHSEDQHEKRDKTGQSESHALTREAKVAIGKARYSKKLTSHEVKYFGNNPKNGETYSRVSENHGGRPIKTDQHDSKALVHETKSLFVEEWSCDFNTFNESKVKLNNGTLDSENHGFVESLSHQKLDRETGEFKALYCTYEEFENQLKTEKRSGNGCSSPYDSFDLTSVSTIGVSTEVIAFKFEYFLNCFKKGN